MRRTARMIALTAACLAALDLAVAGGLVLAARLGGPLEQLVVFFEYGRSVPGKIDRWARDGAGRGNLLEVGWIPQTVAHSTAGFAAEPGTPVLREYGMSFSRNVVAEAAALGLATPVDLHDGPGAAPNYVHQLFLEDRRNRRPGDVVVFAVLASALPNMLSLTARTGAFEQPAPMTFPIFGDGRTVEPLVRSLADEMAVRGDPAFAARWRAQLAAEDALYTPFAFAAQWLDVSPLARLTRRTLATSIISARKAEVHRSGRAAASLRRVLRSFAETARADGQVPIVLLIQNESRHVVDLDAIAGATLRDAGVAFVDAADHMSPEDARSYEADGHFRPEVDRRIALGLIAAIAGAEGAGE